MRTHTHVCVCACVPVQPFAERLSKFFHEGLLCAAPHPAPPTAASLAAELRCGAAALLCHARSLPTELPARLQRLGAELQRLGLGLDSVESAMRRAELPARLDRLRLGLEWAWRLRLRLLPGLVRSRDGLSSASARLLDVQTPTWLRMWARARTKAA